MHREACTTAQYTVRDQERMARATNYFGWQARLAREQLGRRVIEIGCGMGNFTRHLLDRELVISIDVVEDCVKRLKERFSEQANIEARVLDVQDVEFTALQRYRPDSIVCLNTLEHVRDDRKALAHMRAVLPPGGRAVFILPAFESLYGPIDANLGHFRRYSMRSWRELAESAGFHPRSTRFFNSIGYLGWWVNAKVLKRAEQSVWQIELFDSAIVPALSRLEGWMSPPFGQSIFAVLEKTG
jgi:SAM-dependent methyltransferase